MTQKSVLFLLVTLSVMGLASAELMPFPGCLILEMAFKMLGCAAEESQEPYCQYMALTLRLQLDNGEPLCEAKPCFGYGQSETNKCTTLFPRSCSSSDRISKGVCPLGRECCNDS